MGISSVIAATYHQVRRELCRRGLSQLLPDPEPEPDLAGRVPAAIVFGLFEAAVSAVGEGFPIQAAQVPRAQSQGLVNLLSDAAPTLQGALERFLRFSALVTDVYRWQQVEEGAHFRLVCAGLPDRLGARWMLYFDLADMLLFGRRAVGAGFAAELFLDHDSDPAAWEAVGVVPQRAEWCGLRVPRSLLSHPMSYANPIVSEVLLREAESRAQWAEPALWQRVRAVIEASLAAGPTAPEVARVLGMSRRTMTRRLHEEGRPFRGLLADVRRARAVALLPHQRVEDVALALGYSEARPFIRAFQRWTGETPAAWRERRRAPA